MQLIRSEFFSAVLAQLTEQETLGSEILEAGLGGMKLEPAFVTGHLTFRFHLLEKEKGLLLFFL